MKVTDIKPFLPARDYAVSQAFYTEIGFHSEYVSDDLTLFENGDCLFFLQRFFEPALAENFMLQICVTNIEDAFTVCSASQHKQRISPISEEPWGKVFYLWGPSGELLHITELK
ncbi:lactoylglutathione lyase [Alteromonas confluentis]|uniref:Lactoylglutathione lyase n=1 Tax=Alteromonas confluentis TaxID=1656094 RepID=A0A1E7Z922_9ALTE|nr:lactoylglutathione lyase [Alteromonas confluentis]OFC70026.1 lactoylglutathione lyase [Alteromonas confluentis]